MTSKKNFSYLPKWDHTVIDSDFKYKLARWDHTKQDWIEITFPEYSINGNTFKVMVHNSQKTEMLYFLIRALQEEMKDKND